ncbi:MAG: HEAT repeat domain-containing protein [Planctomycetota bacterium]
MTNPPPRRIVVLSDAYALEDRIGHAEHVDGLLEMIASVPAATPFAISVVGPRGRGKTSFLRQIERRLQSPSREGALTLWLNPAHAADGADALGQFVQGLSALLRRRGGVKDFGVPEPGRSEDGTDVLAELDEWLAHRAEMPARARATDLSLKDLLRRATRGLHYKIVVLVDDMDRASPRAASNLLDALGLPNFVFVVATVAQEWGVSFDFSLFLPPPDPARLRAHLVELAAEIPEVFPWIERIIGVLGDDLRRLKHFLNAVSYALWLAARKEEAENPGPGLVIQAALIAFRLPEFYRLLREEPSLLIAIQRAWREKGTLRRAALKEFPRFLDPSGVRDLAGILQGPEPGGPEASAKGEIFQNAEEIERTFDLLAPVVDPVLAEMESTRPVAASDDPLMPKGPPGVAQAPGFGWGAARAPSPEPASSLLTHDSKRLSELLSQLDHEAGSVRRAAAESLGAMNDPVAVPLLITKLDDPSPKSRRAAILALGAMGAPESVAPLIRRLEDEDRDVRRAAFGALGRIGDPHAAKALLAKLAHGDARVRQAALGALAYIRRDEIDQRLLSRDFDGIHPWIDPAFPIDRQRVERASRALGLDIETVKRRYEALIRECGISIAWKPPEWR